MNSLFDQIDKWYATNPDGWTTPEVGKIFATCVMALRPEVCVEIGVFGGRSLIPVAMALREVGRGMIIGIDPWKAIDSVQGQSGENVKWWSNQEMHDGVYAKFVENVRSTGVQNCVKIVRKSSNDVAPPVGIGWIVIDGNHGPQVAHDVDRFAKNVIIGGLCYMDDLNWDGGSVLKACETLVQIGFKKLYDVNQGAMFQRIK